MGLLAVIILSVWLVGIIVSAASVAYTLKHDTSDLTIQAQLAMETNPTLVGIVLTLAIVFWPATLTYSLVTGKK